MMMKRLVVVGITATALMAASQAASWAEPDVIGKQYAEAKGMLGKSGLTPIVSTVVGDRVPQDECFVVSTSKVTSRDSSGRATNNQVQVNLSCYGGSADGRAPGYSKGNNDASAVAVRDERDRLTKAWKASAQGQKWCAEFEAEHPEWAPIPDCHPDDAAAE